jgi:hypothetical protein
MNSMNVPSKRSTFERKLDKLILALFSTLFTMCVIGAIGRLSFFRSIFLVCCIFSDSCPLPTSGAFKFKCPNFLHNFFAIKWCFRCCF